MLKYNGGFMLLILVCACSSSGGGDEPEDKDRSETHASADDARAYETASHVDIVETIPTEDLFTAEVPADTDGNQDLAVQDITAGDMDAAISDIEAAEEVSTDVGADFVEIGLPDLMLDGQSDGAWECPYPDGFCNENVYHWCPLGSSSVQSKNCSAGGSCQTGQCVPGEGCVFESLSDIACEDGDLCTYDDECQDGQCVPGPLLDCTDDNPCTLADCDPESGCTIEPIQGPCDDGNLCTTSDTCQWGICAGIPLDCDDANPCTNSVCDPDYGCQTWDADKACNDGDLCTESDWCSAGACSGQLVSCGDGYACDNGLCVCANPCDTEECGQDGCGNVCGVCGQWQTCVESQCIDDYPAPPWGPFEGNIIPNQQYIDPEDMSEVHLGQFYDEGILLLISFSAGWCIVCKNDTQLFNSWHNAYYDSGLRILEVLYENVSSKPADQTYGLYWKNVFNIQYEFWLDTATGTGAFGKAEGGNLPFFRQPTGPLKNGSFPATILVCPQTMEILYISVGFYDEIVGPIVEEILANGSCL